MLLKVKMKDIIVLVEVQNIVLMNEKNKRILDVSCPNLDVYRFSYTCADAQKLETFNNVCESIIEAQGQKAARELFMCSLEEFANIKFEKYSFGSIIN